MRSWFSQLWFSSARQKCRRPRRIFLSLEPLEDRRTPAVITVTTSADDVIPNDGSVSLREAITAINAGNDLGDPNITAQNPGTFGTNDTINFNIAGAGLKTINVGSDPSAAGISLPTIIKPLTINGYTQGAAAANTLANSDNAVLLVELNGASAGGADGLTLGIGSGGSTIKGLAVNRFAGNGVVVQSNGNTIVGNFVGVNAAGTVRMPNGTFPNSGDGIRIENASNNQIGGANPADRNVASGNARDGIHIVGGLSAPATGNLVQGNFVGVAADGKSSVGNRTEPAPAAGAAEGNNLFGIEVSGGNLNTIGGAIAGARNVVGLNGVGIEIDNGGQSNIIQGNYSGVGADGVTPAGNLLHGIDLRSANGFSAPLGPPQANEPGVSFNLIGGTAAGVGNLVEFNGTGGIAVFGNPVSASGQPNIGNAIEGNSIFMNGRNFAAAASAPTQLLGIDLTNSFTFPRDDGLTPNDSKGHSAPNDPNNFQNFPILASAVSSGGQTTITGVLKTAPGSTSRVEFFASNPDPLGLPAEGQQLIGSTSVTADANGNASFNVTLSGSVANNRIVTATATDAIGNTSEFSAGLTVPTQLPPPPPPPPPPPSPSSLPPFVSVAFGPLGEVIELVNSAGILTQFDVSGAHQLGGAGVRSASIAFGPNGEVLEVVTTAGILTQFDATGAHQLGGPGVESASVAFGPNGMVLEVVLVDGSARQFSAAGVQVLATSGVVSASVAFGPSGEVVDIVSTAGILTQYGPSGPQQLGGTGVRSAGVAFSGNSLVLDIIYTDGTLNQFDMFGVHRLGMVP